MNKRSRDDAVDMANCLMLLSKVGGSENPRAGRSFECKTCNRRFDSFQALGGHRASHKKPKLSGDDLLKQPSSPVRPKTHECSICGLEFPMGQALGGHMRRHRGNMGGDSGMVTRALLPLQTPVLKKSNSKRVMCLDLDLDLSLGLTPAKEDLSLRLGEVQTPALKCFL